MDLRGAFRKSLLGVSATERDVNRARKVALMNLMAVIGLVCLVPLGLSALAQGKIALATLDLSLATVVLLCLIYLKKTGRSTVPVAVSAIGTAALYLYLFVSGGASNTGYMWLYTYPLFSHFLLGSRRGAWATTLLFLPVITFLVADLYQPGLSFYTAAFTSRFVPSLLVVFLFSYLFERTREAAQEIVAAKHSELAETIETLREKESELRGAQEHLEQRIEERTEELRLANEQLSREMEQQTRTEAERRRLEDELVRSQKLEMVGTLAGGVAHDLNNILSGLVSYPELLLLKTPEDSPLRKPLRAIQSSGEKAAAVVQDMLTLARRATVVKEVVGLNAVVEEFVAGPGWQQLQATLPGMRVECHLAPELLHLHGSPVHLMKTVMNLILNAAEATPDDGVVHVATENRYVDKPLPGYDRVAEGDYVVLTVTDRGTGIPAEDLPRIFEPFYSKKKLGRSGSGLGMAVVQATVKDHDGYIDVESEQGTGTMFTLYFPASRLPLAAASLPTGIERYMGRGESVLVVDDVLQQREITEDILRRLGYRVDSVASGEAAVEFLQTGSADLVVLDMIMEPGIDGLETYRRLTALRPEQRAIIVSGFSESVRVAEARAIGAGAYVKKPFSIATLGQAVRDELARGAYPVRT